MATLVMIPLTKMADQDNERVFLLLAMYSSDDKSNEHKIIDSSYYAVRMHFISLHTYCLLIKRILEKPKKAVFAVSCSVI
jgi:hypothetical protein